MKKILTQFKNWIHELTKDERGAVSVKPVIAIIGALFLCGTMLTSALRPDFKPSADLVNAVMVITAIGMGADTFDKFSYKKADKKDPDPEV
jgi:hypothetical protein